VQRDGDVLDGRRVRESAGENSSRSTWFADETPRTRLSTAAPAHHRAAADEELPARARAREHGGHEADHGTTAHERVCTCPR
jgi:hypothetical protein